MQSYGWDEGLWKLGRGYTSSPRRRGPQEALTNSDGVTSSDPRLRGDDGIRRKVVALDYGIKRNILRNLVDVGCDVTVVPATASFEDIMAHQPDGLFLSNGPGDPAATGEYAVPVIRAVARDQKAVVRHLPWPPDARAGHRGAHVLKMHQGHRGANHPVKRLSDGAVEITSMNHGFAVDLEPSPPTPSRNPHQPVRRQQLRLRTDRPAGVLSPIPPRSQPWPPGQPLSVREVRGDDGVTKDGYAFDYGDGCNSGLYG